MFADLVHFHHLTQLHIDFGATQIGISNGGPSGTDHAGETSTSTTGAVGASNVGGGGELVNGLHSGGTAINGYIHDFGHNHIDNVTGSDIKGSDGIFGNGDDINQGDWFRHSHYLKVDQFTGPTGTGDDFVPGGRGMFGDYAIHALWSDTTAMDNFRHDGTAETMPLTCSTSTCYHVPTTYTNNDTDNQAYWPHNRPIGNGVRSPGVWGDNGWQRAGPDTNDYTRGDFAAGSGGVPQSAFA